MLLLLKTVYYVHLIGTIIPRVPKKFYSVNLEMSQDDVTKPSTKLLKTNITPKQFDTCIILYYCKNCFLLNCFVCGKKHTTTEHTKTAKCNGCNKKWFIITQTCINKEKLQNVLIVLNNLKHHLQQIHHLQIHKLPKQVLI